MAAIGIDIGSSCAKTAVTNGQGNVLWLDQMPTGWSSLEAAEEIAVQARLRNLVGIIVIDFVDMRDKAHRGSVVEQLIRAFAPDTGRVAINPLSTLGLCEMTRQSRYAAASDGEE